MATCNNITQHVIRYFCSTCNTLLKETDTPLDDIIETTTEDCPNCGYTLRHHVTRRREIQACQSIEAPQAAQQDVQPRRLSFDMVQIDKAISLTGRGSVCVTGSSSSFEEGDGGYYYYHHRYANALLTRLCVRALMSRRHGGLGSQSVLFIDAGNCSDIYQCVDFARQYGLDDQQILDRIFVSRPFTIHQLAGLVIHELVPAIERSRSQLVVISDILKMFSQDPQIDQEEANWLLLEIARALRRVARRVLLVVSLGGGSNNHQVSDMVRWDYTIDISEKSQDILQVAVVANGNSSSSNSQSLLPARDLEIIPAQ